MIQFMGKYLLTINGSSDEAKLAMELPSQNSKDFKFLKKYLKSICRFYKLMAHYLSRKRLINSLESGKLSVELLKLI